jgi:hypothetical protein
MLAEGHYLLPYGPHENITLNTSMARFIIFWCFAGAVVALMATANAETPYARCTTEMVVNVNTLPRDA